MKLSGSMKLAGMLGAVSLSGLALASSMITTIDLTGKLPELAPATSAQFVTLDAGLVRDGVDIGYFWIIKPRAKLDAPVYFRVSYENPCGEPLVNDAEIEKHMDKIGLSSPSYVRGLEEGQRYSFKLEVFRNKGDATPIDTMEQKVASAFTSLGCP